jgi:hypothetical protein
MKYYVIEVFGDVEPHLFGPFNSIAERDAEAKRMRAGDGDENGYYWLDVHANGKPQIGAYSGAFFKEK